MTVRIFIARAIPGSIGETRRVSHIFQLPPDGETPESLTAYCDASFVPGELELLDGPTGTPCVSCLKSSSSPVGSPVSAS
jgi:hypothetical protein